VVFDCTALEKNLLLCYRTNTMKKEIHPDVNTVKATCVCGANYDVLSTKKDIEVEICSACHPFYTGTEKVLDTAGRVERFRKRQSQAKK